MIHLQCADAESKATYKEAPACVAASFTSIPYNIGLDYGDGVEGDPINDRREENDYLVGLFRMASYVRKVSKPGAPLFINLKPKNPKLVAEVVNAIENAKWKFQHPFAWIYHMSVGEETIGQFSPVRGPNPHWGYEQVFLFHQRDDGPFNLERDAEGVGSKYADKSNLKRFNAGSDTPKADRRCRGNVWLIPYEGKVGRTHPCPFPPALPEMALRMCRLAPGDLVLDPYAGECNTGVAATRLGLGFWGIDLNPEYLKTGEGKIKNV